MGLRVEALEHAIAGTREQVRNLSGSATPLGLRVEQLESSTPRALNELHGMRRLHENRIATLEEQFQYYEDQRMAGAPADDSSEDEPVRRVRPRTE